MRKSVIKSMIFGSLAVMLISLLVVTIVFFYTVKTSFEAESYKDMGEFIRHVKPITQMSLDFSTSRMMKLFDESMQQFSHYSKYNLLITTQNGDIVWSDVDILPSQAKPHIMSAISELGSNPTIRSYNMLSGIYPGRTITIGEIVSSEFGKEAWMIFCTKNMPSASGQYMKLLLEILIMELAALVFMAIFLYFFSRNITSPLRKINNALKSFAKGNFKSRVAYSSSNELGELALNVNNMADSLEHFEKIRSSFISDVSHELRTPMTSISGFVEGILDGTIPREESDKYLKIVLSETKRLSRIVNELLDVSRIESGKQQIKRTDFDISELSKIVLINFEKEITDKNIDVSLEFHTEKCIVNADRDSYTQVLINLIHNAVKFTPENGYIVLKIEEHHDKCLFTVENSGEGIDKEKINFVWERFYKTDDSRSSDKSGIGLGLYIVKRIIDAHDETIKVESIPGKCTRFVFTIALS
ncbi:MAG: HAMP domain-containing histidine kinase [Clostridia bacterium]|nr:HAMP domain-containing histidine kinase [Clostridia bacterium]